MRIIVIPVVLVGVFFGINQVKAIKVNNWQTIFTGYGQVKIHRENILLKPKSSVVANETHAALVVGPKRQNPIKYQISVKTLSQLRKKSQPNPWEVGWVIWHYSDNEHFYYFILKPNGWELGKRDPAYSGGQRFLATGSKKIFPINKKYAIKIIQQKKQIKVYLGKKLIVKYQDQESPYQNGRIGVYAEDAKVRYSDIISQNLK